MIIVVSNFPPPLHGVSLYTQLLVAELKARKIDHRFYRVGERESIDSIERFSLGKIIRDLFEILKALVFGARFAQLQRTPVTVYFTPSQFGFGVLRDVLVVTLSKFLGLKTVGHIHGSRWVHEQEQGGITGALLKWVGLLTNQFICLDERFAQTLEFNTGTPCVTIPNGLPTLSPSQEALLQSKPVPTTQINLLFLSTLVSAKGVFVAGHSLRILRAQGLNARLKCAGNWFNTREREHFFHEFKAEIESHTIEFMGFANEETKLQLLNEAHFLILPILNPFEGQPLTLIESMRAGVPPITTQMGSIAGLFRFSAGTLLSQATHEKPEGIANTIQTLLNSEQLYANTSRACKEHFNEKLNISRCFDQLLANLVS